MGTATLHFDPEPMKSVERRQPAPRIERDHMREHSSVSESLGRFAKRIHECLVPCAAVATSRRIRSKSASAFSNLRSIAAGVRSAAGLRSSSGISAPVRAAAHTSFVCTIRSRISRRFRSGCSQPQIFAVPFVGRSSCASSRPSDCLSIFWCTRNRVPAKQFKQFHFSECSFR